MACRAKYVGKDEGLREMVVLNPFSRLRLALAIFQDSSKRDTDGELIRIST